MEIPPQQLLPSFKDPGILDVTDALRVEYADQRHMVDSHVEVGTAKSIVLELLQPPEHPKSFSFNRRIVGLSRGTGTRTHSTNSPTTFTTSE